MSVLGREPEKKQSGYFDESTTLMWCPECDEPVYRRAGADYEERLCKECFEESGANNEQQEEEHNNA